jgi:transposase InsO family protein
VSRPLRRLTAQRMVVVRRRRIRHVEWVDWFNNRRLLELIGNIPPAEAEERYYAILEKPAMAA